MRENEERRERIKERVREKVRQNKDRQREREREREREKGERERENLLCLHNNFLEKWFLKKIFINTFYYCKMISSKTGMHQTFSLKKILCHNLISEISSSEITPTKIYDQNFLWMQNHFPKKSFPPTLFIKIIFSNIFYG